MSLNLENNKRCNHSNCNKKIKLSDYSCKCGKYFCSQHIFYVNHECDYNYKEENNKENEIKKLECTSIKLEKI
jgi:predicted nucleic acid binding AN1-type Zn finger protein